MFATTLFLLNLKDLCLWPITYMFLPFLFFFFFQAEDGIRDTSVTGVQTCALPIYARARGAVPRCFSRVLPQLRDQGARHQVHWIGSETGGGRARRDPEAGSGLGRSEERRVGKECRSRWSAGDEKKRRGG